MNAISKSVLFAVMFLYLVVGGCTSSSDDSQDPVNGGDTPAGYDADKDGYTIEDGDCDDGDNTVYPGAPELDDGKDNDCDGVTDESPEDTLMGACSGSYSQYSSPEYSGHDKLTQFVTMSDKTRLAVDVFIPADGPPRDAFPVVFTYTPYDRAEIDPLTGTMHDYAMTSMGELLISHGYALVAADMRGTGASFGIQTPFSPILGQDGKELIDWIASQDWCNGNVGMTGGSYVGWSQFSAASNTPEALKCITPEVILFEGYTGGFRPGGIAAINWISSYSALLQGINMNVSYPDFGLFPAAPVVDEDEDGLLEDEIPMMDQGSPLTFIDDIFIFPFGPRYADESNRKEKVYFRATFNHLFNPTFQELSDSGAYIDSRFKFPNHSLTFTIGSPGYLAQEILAEGIATYHIGRWFDGFCKGTPRLYATMSSSPSSKLLMGPGFHQGLPDAYYEYFSYEGEIFAQNNIERLRFFDHHLKGVENGIETEPPVCLYVMNKGWRFENEWPLARQEMTPLCCDAENRLAPERSTDGADEYDVDFSHRSSYGPTSSDRWIMIGYPESVMTRTDKDAKCLTYDTPPLPSDMEITGHPIADLWVTSNQRYGDIFVYLVDVNPHGESVYVTEGQLRAGWHALHNDDDQVNGRIDVQPDLPWHGYRKAQWHDGALNAGEPLNLRFDLIPTSWVFKKGHRIRMAIAGADSVNFEYHPNLSPTGDPAELPSTVIEIHRTDDFPSRIELPVIP